MVSSLSGVRGYICVAAPPGRVSHGITQQDAGHAPDVPVIASVSSGTLLSDDKYDSQL